MIKNGDVDGYDDDGGDYYDDKLLACMITLDDCFASIDNVVAKTTVLITHWFSSELWLFFILMTLFYWLVSYKPGWIFYLFVQGLISNLLLEFLPSVCNCVSFYIK